jgi:predicted dehydrogenase
MSDKTEFYQHALISRLAYKDLTADVQKEWEELGFTYVKFFSIEGAQAYVLGNEDRITIAFRGTEPKEKSDVLADLDDGSHASAWWSKCALGHQNGLSIEIFGSEGSAYWLQADPELILLSNNAGHKTQIHRGSRDCLIAQEPRYNRFKMGHPSGFIEAFSNLYFDISEALITQQTNPFVFDADNSLTVMRTLEALSTSAKTQSWQEV